MAQIIQQVTAPNAWQFRTDLFVLQSTVNLEMVANGAATFINTAVRFVGLAIPVGSTIIAPTKLTYTSDATGSGTSYTTQFRASDEDNAAAITTATDFSTRPRTTASASLSPPIIANDVTQDSPDLSAVVQEVVDRAGWVSGNDMLFFWERVSNTGNNNRSYYHSGTIAKSAILEVNFTPPLVAVVFSPGGQQQSYQQIAL